MLKNKVKRKKRVNVCVMNQENNNFKKTTILFSINYSRKFKKIYIPSTSFKGGGGGKGGKPSFECGTILKKPAVNQGFTAQQNCAFCSRNTIF